MTDNNLNPDEVQALSRVISPDEWREYDTAGHTGIMYQSYFKLHDSIELAERILRAGYRRLTGG